jgi:acyl carrier protein
MSDQILQGVSMVLADTFQYPPALVTRDTEAADVQGWDSLAHSRVILAIERSFGVRLPARRAFVAENVGALCDLVAAAGGRP